MKAMLNCLLVWLAAGCAAAPAREVPAAPQPSPPPPTFDAEIERLARTFATAAVGRTVAVLEFPDLANRTSDLSRLVSEELTTDLVRALGTRGKVVERRQVIQVLQELDLAKADLTQDEVQRVGRRLGATAIVLGSTAVIGREVVVNARLVGVSGIEVVAADRMRVAASADLLGLAGSTPATARPRVAGATRSRETGPAPTLEWTNRELRLQALDVELSGRETMVSVLLTNLTNESTPILLSTGRIYLVDDLGNRYGAVGGSAFGAPGRRVASHQLVSSVPIRLTVVFDDVAESARSVTLVVNATYGMLCCSGFTASLGPLPLERPAR